ncbi:MAG TPA: T9SS type A sorting domain-containing protein [Gemmatimonadaceae bacterium]|nr:T9SS type A sorting domain-containing protein [Gemmatimonadaceae bacterium]
MKHLWRALFIVLVLGAFMPSRSAAQGTSTQTGGGQGAGLQLGQNFPNPVNQDTRIPFVIGDPQGCTDSGRLHRVSLRIYNLLAQLVGVLRLQSGGNAAGGEPLDGLQLTCSQYLAYWDGKHSQTGEDVASGIYLYRLEVDGKVVVKKLIVRK